jgi:O-antigen/teichoic acid export membrane protein
MGTIARQTFKGSVYSYLGAIIGFVNVAILMPYIFSTEQVGLTNILISIAAIFGQFGTLGLNNITTRLFPYFRNKDNNHNGFLFLLLLVGTIGFMLCLIILLLLKPYLINENIDKSPLFVDYIYLLIPLIFITIFYLLIDTYNRILFNASFGTFVKEFLLRIINLIGIALFYFKFFNFNDFIIFYSLVYAIPAILICGLLIYRNEFSLKPSLKYIDKKLAKEMYSVGAYGIIAGFSGIAAMHIDRYMVNHFCDLSSTGVYATAFFFGTIILLPGRALLRIAVTTITESFKTKDYKTVEHIYAKSTVNQLIIACLVFLLIWGNINSILFILPESYYEGKFVIFYISLAYLVFMSGGLSSEIIQFSDYYRQYTLIMILLIVFIVVFNLLLIPAFGMTGAAMASFFSYLLYTLIKFIFIYYKFGYQPIRLNHLYILICATASYFIAELLPYYDILFLDLALKSIAICVLFLVPSYFLNFAPDINNYLHSLIQVFRKK